MTTPLYSALSKIFGSDSNKRHKALFALQPGGGDYSSTNDSDVLANGNAVAYANAEVQLDPRTGQLLINYMQLPTYMAAAFGVAVTANGCVALLQGAANIKVRLNQVVISGHFTAVTPVDLVVYKLSTAPTGGTVVTEIVGKFDSADAASATTTTIYSTPPTLGTIIDVVAAQHKIFGGSTSIGEGPCVFQWPQGGESPALNSASEWFACCILNAGSYAGASISTNVEWTENSY